MKEYDVSDYGIFSNAVGTIKKLNQNIKDSQTTIDDCKSKLNSESVFMGPMCTTCMKGFKGASGKISTMTSNFSTIGNYIVDTSNNYQKGDQTASKILLMDTNTVITAKPNSYSVSGNPKSSVSIPDSIKQAGYTVTCYGEGGWHLGGKAKATRIARGTEQEAVHKAWLKDGARYKSGIAVINVNGQDHYLIATAPTLGRVGDSVNVKLKNGQNVPCVIADSKRTSDATYTKYGHSQGRGGVNVLEFEVERKKYLSSGNPTTSKWNLDWDSSSGVKTVDNYGSILS